ncbi:uncharacterized protein LOC143152553 [Ptiloglossa arizonensis]|uniref:uncharacterized protein LOC143152553 n=1 Tax=Ptiloglossa arizonensis TaxID=3350558 RepID=UPI003FA041AC
METIFYNFGGKYCRTLVQIETLHFIANVSTELITNANRGIEDTSPFCNKVLRATIDTFGSTVEGSRSEILENCIFPYSQVTFVTSRVCLLLWLFLFRCTNDESTLWIPVNGVFCMT